MNFVLRFVLARQLALNAGVSTQQATSDGLIGGMMSSPMGLILSTFLARNQAAAAPRAVNQTPGTAVVKRVAATHHSPTPSK
jgi:hypothetical protein